MPHPAGTRASAHRRCIAFVVALVAIVLVVLPLPASADDPAPGAVENVVFILVDDLGWADLGCYGSTFHETRNIDRLAESGLRFTDAYAACPVCSPTRAAILTGRYPVRTRITDYISPDGGNQPERWKRDTRLLPAAYADRLSHAEVTLAEALKESGRATFFAGKWHLGPEGHFPEDQGFDINRGGLERGGPYGGSKYFSPYGNPRLEDGPPGEHLPDRLADETVRFLEANRERPFFAFLSFYSVHTPLMAREDLRDKYLAKRESAGLEPAWGSEGTRKVRLVQEHAIYAGMVEAMDLAVGKVTAALDRLGLADRTAVVFTSDNGGLSTSEGHPTSNLPLRAGKGWMYEGGIRVPLIVRWPGATKAGSVSDAVVTSTDFFPTILEGLGLPSRAEQHADGISFLPVLQGKNQADRDAVFWHYPHYGNQGGAPCSALRDGDWKLIEWLEDGRTELFHLAADPGESTDLAERESERTAALRERLHRWREETGAVLPAPNPAWSGAANSGR